MKKTLVVLLSFMFFSLTYYGQTFSTRTGKIIFKSSTSEELIEAVNNDVAAKLNINDGGGLFIVPIKSFKFKKALMQEHFNENYMESDRYTKAQYKFKLNDISKIDFKKNGKYSVTTTGELTIKNVSKKISVTGYIIVNGKSIDIETNFDVDPNDYNISIPNVVKNKIAKKININVKTSLKQ